MGCLACLGALYIGKKSVPYRKSLSANRRHTLYFDQEFGLSQAGDHD